MPRRREYLSRLPLRITPLVRRRAEQALRLGMIEPRHYVRAAVSVEPPVDVMLDEDPRLRIALLATLADQPTLEAWRLLERMTRDPDDHVRTHAAQALERIDEQWCRRVEAAKHQVARRDTPEGWAELARAYLTLARLHRASAVLQEHHLLRASAALERALRRDERPEWLLLRAAIEADTDQPDAAAATVRRLLTATPDDPDALLLLAKLAFQQGDYAQAQEWCRVLSTLPGLSEQMTEQVRFWVGQAPASM